MVMAETERKSRVEPTNTTSLNRLQWLRQRREALEEKLVQKNNELKNLCIDEAELTGILPPEIPLDPGESPPFFRRRVGTSFAYPQNLINKLKTNEADESTLELERQVQASIAKAAYDIFNDATKGKAVRRKNRLVYQQSQKRLKELETRLSFIRQGYGRLSRRQTMETTSWTSTYPDDVDEGIPIAQTIAKHKSKKPRPPLHSAPDKLLSAQINYDKLIKAVSIDDQFIGVDQHHKQSDKSNEWISNEIPIPSRKGSRNDSDIVHDLNDNTDVYILPNQHSAPLYSHDGEETSPHHMKYNSTHVAERAYRVVPNIKDNTIGKPNNVWPREQKRQCEISHYNQRQPVKTHKHPQRYQHYYHRDNISPTINEMTSIQSSNSDSLGKLLETNEQYRPRHAYYPLDQYPHLLNAEDGKEFPTSLQERESMKEKMFKRNSHENMSLSRRQDLINANDNWSTSNDDVFWACSDYQPHTDRFGSIDRRKYSNSNLHSYQTAVNNQDMLTTINKVPVQGRLIKQNNSFIDSPTSSPKYLNNKQTQSVHCDRIELPPSTRILLRTQSLGSVETWHSGDTKCVTPVMETTSGILLPTTAGSVYRAKYPVENSHDTRVSYRDNEKEWYETSIDLDYSKPNTLSQTMRNLEIPAESNNRINSSQISGDVSFESSGFNTSEKIITDGRTIIHAGKYQPYKEVTKPFEMSDFYKYSTKFRKKMESTGQGVNQGPNSGHHASSLVPPVQQRVSISNQINVSCQSYVAQRGNDNMKDCSNIQTCQPTSKDSTVV